MEFDIALSELMKRAKRPLATTLLRDEIRFSHSADPVIVSQLLSLLLRRNGFYFSYNGLHVFPLAESSLGYDLEMWNHPGTWRGAYSPMDEGLLFFAEDMFGDQFAILGSEIYRFDAETGELKLIGNSLTDWIERILAREDYETGGVLGDDWQKQNRLLLPTERLHPIVPFVMGGLFKVDNLYAMDAVEGMLAHGYIATQIQDLPDGTTVTVQKVNGRLDIWE